MSGRARGSLTSSRVLIRFSRPRMSLRDLSAGRQKLREKGENGGTAGALGGRGKGSGGEAQSFAPETKGYSPWMMEGSPFWSARKRSR